MKTSLMIIEMIYLGLFSIWMCFSIPWLFFSLKEMIQSKRKIKCHLEELRKIQKILERDE